ncbi:hypothetical protein Tco_0926396 [Tanacetum coccineum]|uniref:Transposase (Putative), gypsy type n=1 Tax=Tanacetum coccineum TaxID=301880 RepID=A0ABQ5DAU7_9ASTR
MSRFSESVNNHPDRILTSRHLWQFSHEVHGDLFPLLLGNLRMYQQTGRLLVFSFNLCTSQAFADVEVSGSILCLVGLSRHYTLDEETYPWFLHKNGEEMDIFAFIHALDPTKVKIIERERNEGEPLLLKTTIGRTVPLLPVAPDRAKSGGEGADIQLVSEPTDTVVEDVAPLQPRHQKKRKTVVVDAGESSHPPKRLKEDHETLSGTSVGGKSMSAVQRLLAEVVLNAKVRVAAIPTLPFVTASISTTPEHDVGDHTDSVVVPNLRTIGAPQRFVISLYSSHHSDVDVAEAEVDSLFRSSDPIMTTVTIVTSTFDPALVAKEKPVKPSLFSADSSSASGTDPNTSVFSDLTGSDFLVGGIRTVINPDTDLQKMVDEFAPPKFFASVRGTEHDQLFTEFNFGAARQMSLSAEVRMRVEYNVKERKRSKPIVEKQDELLKARDGEIEDLKAQLLLKETEAAEATRLFAQTSNLEAVEKSFRDEVNTLKERNAILKKDRNALDVKVTDLEALVVHELEISSAGLQEKITVYDNCMEQLEKFQDDRMKVVNDKLAKLDADLAKMACHLEERFYPHLLNTISGRRWLLTYGLKLFLVKCLNSSEYLTALGAAISRAIEKGMQSGLAAGIDHGALADAPRINDLQPDIEQLKVPIHRSEDQVVLGETSLSFSLSVSHSRVERIRENIAGQRTFGVMPAAFMTTTALSTTFASANSIPLISINDYEIVGANGQEGAGTDGQVVADGNVAPFPNVDDSFIRG